MGVAQEKTGTKDKGVPAETGTPELEDERSGILPGWGQVGVDQ